MKVAVYHIAALNGVCVCVCVCAAGEGFNMDNNLLFCSECFSSLFGATCYGCSKRIAGEELWVEALDHQWHPACFSCEVHTHTHTWLLWFTGDGL